MGKPDNNSYSYHCDLKTLVRRSLPGFGQTDDPQPLGEVDRIFSDVNHTVAIWECHRRMRELVSIVERAGAL